MDGANTCRVRSRNTEKVKTNLMVFIRPQILRDAPSAAIETNEKYRYIREVQMGAQGDSIPLMPRTDRPVLPPLTDEDVALEMMTPEEEEVTE